jgi:hypothetical protein
MISIVLNEGNPRPSDPGNHGIKDAQFLQANAGSPFAMPPRARTDNLCAPGRHEAYSQVLVVHLKEMQAADGAERIVVCAERAPVIGVHDAPDLEVGDCPLDGRT